MDARAFFDDVPIDLVKLIFEHIDCRSQIALTMTSKRFYSFQKWLEPRFERYCKTIVFQSYLFFKMIKDWLSKTPLKWKHLAYNLSNPGGNGYSFRLNIGCFLEIGSMINYVLQPNQPALRISFWKLDYGTHIATGNGFGNEARSLDHVRVC